MREQRRFQQPDERAAICRVRWPSVRHAQDELRHWYGQAVAGRNPELECQGLPAEQGLGQVAPNETRPPVPVATDVSGRLNEWLVNQLMPRLHVPKTAGMQVQVHSLRTTCHPQALDEVHIAYKTSSTVGSIAVPLEVPSFVLTALTLESQIIAWAKAFTRKEHAQLLGRCLHSPIALEAYAHYCREVTGLADLRLAPFHILASEGKAHVDRDHVWHMTMLARLGEAVPDLVIPTPYRVVDLADDEASGAAVAWWEDLTARGGEGMVVKPLDFIARGKRGLLQPAVKCRGPEYLRIIYGPEYLRPANLERLRERGLSGKRSLALSEFALGVESLERFVRKEPLRQVHECAFAVLALESEPIDPRL